MVTLLRFVDPCLRSSDRFRWFLMTGAQNKSLDLSFATSQPEFLPTLIGKLWTAISANQEKGAIFGNNVTKIFDFV